MARVLRKAGSMVSETIGKPKNRKAKRHMKQNTRHTRAEAALAQAQDGKAAP